MHRAQGESRRLIETARELHDTVRVVITESRERINRRPHAWHYTGNGRVCIHCGVGQTSARFDNNTACQRRA